MARLARPRCLNAFNQLIYFVGVRFSVNVGQPRIESKRVCTTYARKVIAAALQMQELQVHSDPTLPLLRCAEAPLIFGTGSSFSGISNLMSGHYATLRTIFTSSN